MGSDHVSLCLYPMKISQLTIRNTQIPLRWDFSPSHTTTRMSNAIIVEVETESGIVGYGESCPRPYVTGETAISVWHDLSRLQGEWIGRYYADIGAIRSLIREELEGRIGLAARCALELALLDAWGKTKNRHLISLLGGIPKPYLSYGGMIPMLPVSLLKPLMGRFLFKEVKIKIGRNLADTLQRIATVQDMYGREVRIRLDANSSWKPEDAASQIPVLIRRGIQVFEQLFPPERDRAMKPLVEKYGSQVCFMADESATSYQRIQGLLENGYYNGLNLKISKHGGIFNTLAILELAASYEVSCRLGAYLGETSLLTAAGIVVSTVAQGLIGYDSGLGSILLEQDLAKPALKVDPVGVLELTEIENLPGLGLEIDAEVLECYARSLPEVSGPLY